MTRLLATVSLVLVGAFGLGACGSNHGSNASKSTSCPSGMSYDEKQQSCTPNEDTAQTETKVSAPQAWVGMEEKIFYDSWVYATGSDFPYPKAIVIEPCALHLAEAQYDATTIFNMSTSDWLAFVRRAERVCG